MKQIAICVQFDHLTIRRNDADLAGLRHFRSMLRGKVIWSGSGRSQRGMTTRLRSPVHRLSHATRTFGIG